MMNNECVNKTELVIQGFLALTRRHLSRTQIVKLVYLADNLFYESTGRTITDTQYQWDHCGPNSVGSTIADAADRLAINGEAQCVSGSYKGSPTHNYRVDSPGETWAKVAAAMSAGERQIVQDIARKYGKYNATELAKISKKTKPFKDIEKYDRLSFKQSERAKEVRQYLASIDGLKEEVELGIADADAGRLIRPEDI